jgi:hypothetical protein
LPYRSRRRRSDPRRSMDAMEENTPPPPPLPPTTSVSSPLILPSCHSAVPRSRGSKLTSPPDWGVALCAGARSRRHTRIPTTGGSDFSWSWSSSSASPTLSTSTVLFLSPPLPFYLAG